jgi:hypothetical protein
MATIRWLALSALLGIVAAGCGGGSGELVAASTTPVGIGKTVAIEKIADCMERGGAKVTKVLDEAEGAFQMLYALNPEATFNIVNLAGPRLDRRMTKFMESSARNGGVKGKLVITPVDEGWTLIGVVAAPETGKPLPSAASEELAKGCAVRPTT